MGGDLTAVFMLGLVCMKSVALCVESREESSCDCSATVPMRCWERRASAVCLLSPLVQSVCALSPPLDAVIQSTKTSEGQL